MAASDLELGYAGVKAYAGFAEGVAFLVALFAVDRPELVALIEADHLGRLRTGAASAVAAKHLAREGATSLGVIGCGDQAETQVSCIRAAVPTIERVVAYCRTERNLRAFCKRVGAEPAESNREAAEQDIVVTITTSRDPVLRGEWLRPGALVCAAGANNPAARELDNVVLERATFVCCDWLEQARIESADLIEPIQQGVLDWLEVHELQEVVAGELPGRQSPDDIISSSRTASQPGTSRLPRQRSCVRVSESRARALAGACGLELAPRVLDSLVAEGLNHFRPVEQAQAVVAG